MPESGSNAGRSLKFQDVEELESKIDAYFAECGREEDTCQYKHGETFDWTEDDGKQTIRCKECRGTTLDMYALPTKGCNLVSGELKEKLSRPSQG